jgi:hypothetical protein
MGTDREVDKNGVHHIKAWSWQHLEGGNQVKHLCTHPIDQQSSQERKWSYQDAEIGQARLYNYNKCLLGLHCGAVRVKVFQQYAPMLPVLPLET